jgi:hypothetical protein
LSGFETHNLFGKQELSASASRPLGPCSDGGDLQKKECEVDASVVPASEMRKEKRGIRD